MIYKLYTLDNNFIEETNKFPNKFTGIIEYTHGTKQWLFDGKQHRLNGPAFESPNGHKEWWIDDKKIKCKTNEEFLLLIDIMKLKGLL